MLSKAHARKPWNLNIKHGVTLIPWGGTPRQIFHLFLLFHPVIGTRLLPQALTCHSRDGLVSNNSNSWRREHRALGYPQFSFSRTSSDTSGQETLCFVCKITSQRPYKKLSSLVYFQARNVNTEPLSPLLFWASPGSYCSKIQIWLSQTFCLKSFMAHSLFTRETN
jgi:hypothetical protein